MQRALFIDEILRQIFQFSSEDQPNTLSALARSCRSWNDPALDYLWMRLSSIMPLLQLISGIQLVNGFYVLPEEAIGQDMSRFYLYARRVKYISHCRSIQVHPSVLSLFPFHDGYSAPYITGVLSSLRTVRLSSVLCDSFHSLMSLSNNLNQLDLDLGFKTTAPRTTDDGACDYIEKVIQTAPGFRNINVRGILSKRMNSVIASMQNLHTLSLRVGTSLSTETLAAVTTFQVLSELEVHAAHFQADALAGALRNQKLPALPSLKKFHIRAQTPVIELFLEIISSDTLHTLRIEAEDSAATPMSWRPIFELICSRAANTLQSLTLEHHIELDEPEVGSEINSSPTDSNDPIDTKLDIQIPFPVLKVLSGLGCLRQLTLDMTLPVDVCDQELGKLFEQWPQLEYLDMGCVPTIGCVRRLARQPMTLQSLSIFAKNLPSLTSLVIPADPNTTGIEAMDFANIPNQKTLTRISLGYPSTPDPTRLAQYLHKLFPSLTVVSGLPEQELEESWCQTQVALRKFHSAPK